MVDSDDEFAELPVGETILPCKPRHWIEIELVDSEEQPLPGKHYLVKAPDGKEIQGILDENGFARIELETSGECMVCFDELDKRAWVKENAL